MELIPLRYAYNIELDNSSIIREKFLFSLLDKSNVALQHLHHRSNFFFLLFVSNGQLRVRYFSNLFLKETKVLAFQRLVCYLSWTSEFAVNSVQSRAALAGHFSAPSALVALFCRSGAKTSWLSIHWFCPWMIMIISHMGFASRPRPNKRVAPSKTAFFLLALLFFLYFLSDEINESNWLNDPTSRSQSRCYQTDWLSGRGQRRGVAKV